MIIITRCIYIITIISVVNYLTIIIHELGHLIVATIVGIPIKIFSLGIGPKIFSFKKKNIHYQLALIPGGYVKPDVENEQDFFTISLKKRILYYLGGIVANLIICFFMLIIKIIFYPEDSGIALNSLGSLLNWFDEKNILYILICIMFICNVNFFVGNLLPMLSFDGGKIIFSILDYKFPRFLKPYMFFSLFATIVLAIILLYLLIKYI